MAVVVSSQCNIVHKSRSRFHQFYFFISPLSPAYLLYHLHSFRAIVEAGQELFSIHNPWHQHNLIQHHPLDRPSHIGIGIISFYTTSRVTTSIIKAAWMKSYRFTDATRPPACTHTHQKKSGQFIDRTMTTSQDFRIIV